MQSDGVLGPSLGQLSPDSADVRNRFQIPKQPALGDTEYESDKKKMRTANEPRVEYATPKTSFRSSEGHTALRVIGFCVAITLFLNISQLIGGIAANSLSLISECMHMMIDCVSYLLVFGVEKLKYSGIMRRRHIAIVDISGFLISVLISVATQISIMYEALERIRDTHAEQEVVNGMSRCLM